MTHSYMHETQTIDWMKLGDVTENGLFSIVDYCSIVNRFKMDCV